MGLPSFPSKTQPELATTAMSPPPLSPSRDSPELPPVLSPLLSPRPSPSGAGVAMDIGKMSTIPETPGTNFQQNDLEFLRRTSLSLRSPPF